MGGERNALSDLLGTPEQAVATPGSGRTETKRVAAFVDPLRPTSSGTPTTSTSTPDRDGCTSPVSPGVVLGSPVGSSPASPGGTPSNGRVSMKLTKQELSSVVEARYASCAHKWRNAGGTMGNKPCSYCSKAIWSLKSTMKCSLCAMIVHVECLPPVLANSPNSSLASVSNNGTAAGNESSSPSAAPTPPARDGLNKGSSTDDSNGSLGDDCPLHVVQNVSIMKPTTCSNCKEYIWGVVKQAYECKSCKRIYHKKCALALGLDKFNTRTLKREARKQEREEESENRNDATMVLKGLLSDFGKRWSLRRKVALANPVSLVRVAMRHSKQYKHLPRRLALLKDLRAAQECAHAMLFAKAVYGVAYANGHLRSVGSAMRMHTILKPFKDVGHDYASRENDEGVLKSLGEMNTPLREILMSEWTNRVFCPAFALFADHEKKWLVLSIRGTVSDKDTLTDLAAKPAPFLEQYVKGGQAHAGMVQCTATVVKHDVLNECMQRSTAAYPDYRIIVTGHSLGGAVATMYTILARHDTQGPAWKSRVECFAFGPPPTVNGQVLEKVAQGNYITSVICGMDMVPRTSLTNLERLARELAGFKSTELHDDNPHARMHIPGSLLLIHHPIVGKAKKDRVRVHRMPSPPSAAHVHATIENVAPPSSSCRVPQNECTHWLISTLYVSNSMFGDHLPDRYHNSLVYWAQLTTEGLAEKQRKVEAERAVDAAKNKLRPDESVGDDDDEDMDELNFNDDEDDDDLDLDVQSPPAQPQHQSLSPHARPHTALPARASSTPPPRTRPGVSPAGVPLQVTESSEGQRGDKPSTWRRFTSAFKKKDKPDQPPVSSPRRALSPQHGAHRHAGGSLTPGGTTLSPKPSCLRTPDAGRPLSPKTSILSNRSSHDSTPPPAPALATSTGLAEPKKPAKRVSILEPSVSSMDTSSRLSNSTGAAAPML